MCFFGVIHRFYSISELENKNKKTLCIVCICGKTQSKRFPLFHPKAIKLCCFISFSFPFPLKGKELEWKWQWKIIHLLYDFSEAVCT